MLTYLIEQQTRARAASPRELARYLCPCDDETSRLTRMRVLRHAQKFWHLIERATCRESDASAEAHGTEETVDPGASGTCQEGSA